MWGKRARWIAWLAAGLVGSIAAITVDDLIWRILAAGGVLLVLAGRRQPLVGRLSEKARTHLLVLLAIACAAQAMMPGVGRLVSSDWVRVWNVFHYYLGSKYFTELGYHDLYRASLQADQDGYWNAIARVRDLRSYAVVPRLQALENYDAAAHFRAERWHAFQRDVAALQLQRPAEAWRGIFRDRGYNPTPAWTAIGRLLTWPSAERTWFLKLLTVLDLVLLGAALAVVAHACGARAAALATLFFVLSPVNDGRIVGGFLQYDWLAALAAGVAWLRGGRPALAGAAVAYAVSTRVFPLVFVASTAIPLVRRFVLQGEIRRSTWRFVVAFTVGCAFWIGAGVVAAGTEAWPSFLRNIAHHNDIHPFGDKRLGLAHTFTRDIRGLDFRRPSDDDRRKMLERQQPLYRLAAGGLLLLWLGATLRRPAGDAFVLGLVPFFAFAVSSRYYWSVLALLPLLARPGPAGRRRGVRFDRLQAALLGVLALVGLNGFDGYALYSFFDLALGMALVIVAGTFLLHDLRVVRRHQPLVPDAYRGRLTGRPWAAPWHRSRPLVAAFSVAVFLLLCWLRMPDPSAPIRDVDEAVSALIADAWLDGGVPYRDAIDQRGPVTYAIYAAVFAVAGRHNMPAVHWALLVLIFVACGLVARFGTLLRPGVSGVRIGAIAAVLLALGSFSYRRSQMLAFHTEWPMMLFNALGLFWVWRSLKRPPGGRAPSRWLLFAGLCFGLGFLSKQPGLFDAGAAAVFVLLWQARHGRLWSGETLRIGCLLATGFAGVLGVTAGYFAAHGSLGDFVLYYWTYNVDHYAAVVPLADKVAGLDPFDHRRHFLTANPLLFAGAVIGGLAALAGALRGRLDGRLLITLWLAFGYLGASLSGRNFGHYFIQILPPICLLTALVLDHLWRRWAPSRRAWKGLPDVAVGLRVVLVVLVLATAAAPVVRFGDELGWSRLWRERGVDHRRMALVDAIRRTTGPDDQIFVWGYYPELYVLAPRAPASRYSNTNYLTGMLPWENHQPGVDTSAHVVDGAWDILMRELEAARPRLIVDTAVGNHRFYVKYPIDDFPRLRRFLDRGYRVAETVVDDGGRPVATLWLRSIGERR